jgi:hypothetical protein
MKILELHINSFGKLKNKHIRFSDRFNLIYGYNEAGKSTIHSFIKAMLFGMDRTRVRANPNDAWSRYLPWDLGADYSGSMKVSYKDSVYRIERNFSRQAAAPLTLIDETGGEKIDSPQNFINTKFLNNMSMLAYDNTVSISQLKSSTDHDMTIELKNYIANMNNSGNPVINIEKALDILKKERRAYASRIVPEASKNYAANLSTIRSIENNLNIPKDSSKAQNLILDKQRLDMQINKLGAAKEELISKLSANRQKLSDKSISSAADIEERKKEAQELFENYQHFAANSKANMYKFAGIVSLVFSAIFAIFIVYMYLFNKLTQLSSHMSYSHNITMIFLIIAFIIASVSALICMLAYSKDRNALDTHLGDLYELLNIHTRLSIEPGLSNFNSKMDKLLTVLDEVDAQQQELDRLSKELSELNGKKQSVLSGIDSSNRSVWEQEKELEQLADLSDENEALKAVIDENERLQFEVDALDLSIETMDSLSSTIKDSFGVYLNKEASEFVKGITGGIYDSMSIDENLDIALNTKNKLIPMNQMSSSTIDQIYLALRLATAKLMSKGSLPLFLDDSFVNYDNSRLRTVLDYLYKSYRSQIIIFTCHTREEQTLRSIGAKFNFLKI